MSWPMSQDYNESIQTPAECFADPELKQGQPVCNAMGLPVPCSGNFADVYAVQTPQRKWAIKCFTREIPGIRERYVEISKFLQQLKLPFMVEFQFLEQGMRIRGQWYPVLKMHWVEGFTLNHFVRQQLDKPAVLNSLCQMWLKMAVRLRQGQLAHCDLQHGNVLMVPGAKAGMLSLRLVDYDGMCVPALELLKPIEVGHPNFQHPQRLQEGTYNVEVDRFSHLVIYTALRALAVGGKGLWDKFDNGDNLLFKKTDLLAPAGSPLFAELQALPDPEVHKLADALAAAAQKPLEQTPFLEELVNGHAAPAVKKPATAGSKPAAAPAGDIVQSDGRGQHKENATAKRGGGGKLAWIAVGGGAAVLALAAGVFFLVAGGQKTPPTGPAFAKRPTQSQPAFRPQSSTTNAEPKVEPKVEAKVEPKVEAKVEPKVEAKVEPKVEAKVEPKVEAKVEPKVEAKVEPKVEPKVESKVEPKVERLPVPEAGDIARADKFIKELFKVDYARRGAADRLALAKQLLQQGSTTKEDAAARFVCYREARDLAVGVPEPALAVTAIDALAREFNVDDLELKTAALEQIARATGTPGSNKALFDTATALIEPALARDKHDLAVSLAKAAQFGAVRGKLPSLLTAAAGASVREVEGLKRDFAAVQAASAILLTMPDDPAANRLVGKHHFFTRGDAPQGLPLLAKSDDAKLKALADRDLAGTKDAREQMAIGDAWHDVAESETGIAKRHGQRRAALWYQQALPALTGLDQTKVQRRLQALGGIVSAAPVGPAKLEAPPMPVTTKDEKGAFVLVLGGKDRKFDTLAEAVQAARDGDTITVHGNGPFVSEPITIARPLAIRAGAGYRPVIKLSPAAVSGDKPLITTTAALVLEGLEIQRASPDDKGRSGFSIGQAPFLAANCRFRAGIWVGSSPGCVFRNCEFLLREALCNGRYGPGSRVLFDNCLFWTNWSAIALSEPALQDVSIQVKRGTFACGHSLNLGLQSPLPATAARPPVRFDASGSIFDGYNVVQFVQTPGFLAKSAELGPAPAEAVLQRLLGWRGERNLFAAGITGRIYVTWSIKWERNQPPHGPINLAEWKQFWKGAETDSLEGPPRYQGGDLRSRPAAALDQLTPEDFRLLPNSPGYRAGKDGKDLGADVDLVGPGAAYERWKKTPEYQQWLKDPGQMK